MDSIVESEPVPTPVAPRRIKFSDIAVFILALLALFLGLKSLIDSKVFVGLFWSVAGIVIAFQRYRNIQGKKSNDAVGKKLTTTENILMTIFLVPLFLIFLGVTVFLLTAIKQPLDVVLPIISAVLTCAIGLTIFRNWKRGR